MNGLTNLEIGDDSLESFSKMAKILSACVFSFSRRHKMSQRHIPVLRQTRWYFQKQHRKGQRFVKSHEKAEGPRGNHIIVSTVPSTYHITEQRLYCEAMTKKTCMTS